MGNHQVSIRRYETRDEDQLFSLLEREGAEWKDYWLGTSREKYRKALSRSITYLFFEDKELCGYARCCDDNGYGIYVYDLLVDKSYRGKEYGRRLLEQICLDFSDDPIYVLGDNYPYYEKLGYETEGTIYIVKPKR